MSDEQLLADLKGKLACFERFFETAWINFNDIKTFRQTIINKEVTVNLGQTTVAGINAVEAEEVHQAAAAGFNGGNWRGIYDGICDGYGRGNYGDGDRKSDCCSDGR